MEFRNRFKQYPKHSVSPKRTEVENTVLPVYGNLAITPSQIEKMADQGIPVSSQNMAYIPDKQGEANPSWNLPLSDIRGIDAAELWEQSESSKHRIRNAHKRDRERFGDVES